MARYRSDLEDREYYETEERRRRESPWRYDEPYARSRRSLADYDRGDYGRGRFGERAGYEHNEPRYTETPGAREQHDYGYSRAPDREYSRQRFGLPERFRSRLRCRDIMTRDLAVASKENTLQQVAEMMKEEDTGVIPIIEYKSSSGNGQANLDENRINRQPSLLGLITDRDIGIRAVAEGKDCSTTRAGEVMTTDILTARPNERVVDVLRKMGDKQVRRIPVVGENGNLLGMISLGDIALETEADQELAEALEEISKKSSFWNRLFW